ncbi:hypothetical protein [Flavobacterium johnsoniae]|uniref:hypothetical protein n=1 Tax=Flavobacterium johnsoniae TaxID=986 RepID=UPI0011EC0F0E|nr:hypothetical protein [Flavobacterium johnsoniae]
MVHKLVSILLLLALMGSNFSRYFVLAGFQANSRYIADTLCENRTRPQLHCNGKCYLIKKLKQADESEKKQAEKNELSNSEIGLLQRALHVSFAVSAVDAAPLKTSLLRSFRYAGHYTGSIFRPPRQQQHDVRLSDTGLFLLASQLLFPACAKVIQILSARK